MKKAFTLIELLVVISVISLLSSIILTSLGTTRQKAADIKNIALLKEVQKAMELYAADHNGQYPLLDDNWTEGCFFCDSNNWYPLDINDGSLALALRPYLDLRRVQVARAPTWPETAYASVGGPINPDGLWFINKPDGTNTSGYKAAFVGIHQPSSIPASMVDTAAFDQGTCAGKVASVASSDTARGWNPVEIYTCIVE